MRRRGLGVWLRISGQSQRGNGCEAPLWWFHGGGGLDLGQI